MARLTNAKQHVALFHGRKTTDSDRRNLAAKVMDYADDNNLVIVEMNMVRNDNGPPSAYVVFESLDE